MISRPFTKRETNEEPSTLLQYAVEWAMEAGKLQLQHFRSQRLAMTTKLNKSDVVTEVDKACESMLIDHVKQTYPHHSILAEETGSHSIEGAEWEWIIDPLDGTNNYSQGLPVFAVSIGIRQHGITQVGVVYVPLLDDLFTAVRGQGAVWNGKSIHVSRKADLAECVLGTGFPYDKNTVGPANNNLNNVCNLLPQLRGLRRMGAAAYDLCCVAAGLLDGYWEMNLKPWDACAGELIVEEAGGTIRPFRSDRNISIIAGNEILVAKIAENII